MRRLVISLIVVVWQVAVFAQEPLEHEFKVYTDEEGKVYVQKSMPIYLNFSVSAEAGAKNYRLKSQETPKYADPLYLDAEGYNSFKAPWAVNKETQETVYPLREVIYEIYADSKPPVINVDYSGTQVYEKNAVVYTQGAFELKFKVYDATAGVENVYVSLDEAPFRKYEKTVTLSAEKKHVVQYYAVDNVGNAGKVKRAEIIVDKTAPKTSLNFKGDQHEKVISARTILSLEADENNDLKGIFYQLDNQPVKLYRTPLRGAWMQQGEHTIRYFAEDKMGNKEKHKEYTFYVDKTPPTIVEEVIGSSYMANGREYSSGRTKLKLTAFDNKAGIKEIHYSINGGDFKKYEKPVTLNAASGNLSIKTFGIDNVNNKTQNTQQTTQTKIPYIDLSGPELFFNFQGPVFKSMNKIYVSNQTKIALKGRDTEAGMNRIEYALDQGSTQTYVEPFSINGNGKHEIKFYGYDNVENSNHESFHVIVDTSGPEIYEQFSVPAVEEEAASKVYPSHVVLFLSSIDQQSGFEKMLYSLNNAPMKMYQDNIRYFKNNTDINLEIKAFDKLGNHSNKKLDFSIAE